MKNPGSETNDLEPGIQDAFVAAVELVVASQCASASLLMRRLGLGFANAGALLDELEDAGVVSGAESFHERSVLLAPAELDAFLQGRRTVDAPLEAFGHLLFRQGMVRTLDHEGTARIAAFWEPERPIDDEIEFFARIVARKCERLIPPVQAQPDESRQAGLGGEGGACRQRLLEALITRAAPLRNRYYAERGLSRMPRQIRLVEMQAMLKGHWAQADQVAYLESSTRDDRRGASLGEGRFTAEYLLARVAGMVRIPVSRSNTEAIMDSLADTMAEFWRRRGGRKLPAEIEPAVRSVSHALAVYTDLAAGEWDIVDAAGLPERPSARDIALMLRHACLRRVEDSVRGRLAYDVSHAHQVPLASLLDEAADRAIGRIGVEIARAHRAASARLSLADWAERPAAPAGQPFGVSPAGAEAWVRDWMAHMGAVDAVVTRRSGDGGIDIVADGWVAQVKLYTSSVGIEEVRQLVGAAAAQTGSPGMLFFCSGGFSPSAPEFADSVGMALFRFVVETGAVTAINAIASDVMDFGLSPGAVAAYRRA